MKKLLLSLIMASLLVGYAFAENHFGFMANYGRTLPLETSFGKIMEHGPAYGGSFTFYQSNVGFIAELSREELNFKMDSWDKAYDYGFDVYQGGVLVQAPDFWFFDPALTIMAGYSRPWLKTGDTRSFEDFHFTWTVGGKASFGLFKSLNAVMAVDFRNLYFSGPKQWFTGKVGLEYLL